MSRKKLPRKKIICKQCNKEFEIITTSKRIYCSDKCHRDSWIGSRKNSVLQNCIICNKEFYAWPSRIKDGKDKCCSKKCAVERMKVTSYLILNNPSKTPEGKERLKLQQKGDKSWNWKGGITPEIRKIRNSTETILWRKACFERDNYTCQATGQRGGKLVVHHINNFADFPELRTSISNGITLLDSVHREFHKKYGRRNNTLEQLQEFIKENAKGRFGII